MLSPRPLALAALASLLAAGCTASSDRAHRGHAVAPDDPWPALSARARDGDVRPAAARAGLQQLEDVVEHAASRVLGRDVDLATPELEPGAVFLAALELDTGRVTTTPLPPWLAPAGRLGSKYVADHVGAELLAGLDGEARAAASTLALAVRAHVEAAEGAGTEPRVRAAEAHLAGELGLDVESLHARAARLDTSVWERSGHTRPPGPLRGPRVVLAYELLREPPDLQLFVYAHELWHALVAEGSGAAERGPCRAHAVDAAEVLALDELAAQAFAVRVLRELARTGAVPCLEVPSLDALPGDPLAAEAVSPNEQEARRRLAALYRPPRPFRSRALVAARYGYGDAARLRRVDAAMTAWGVAGYLGRVAGGTCAGCVGAARGPAVR